MKRLLKHLYEKAFGNIGIGGVLTVTLRNLDGSIALQKKIHNANPDIFKELIAEHIAESSPSRPLKINYVALATGTGTPVTQLDTEIFRKVITSVSQSGKTVTISAFFTAPEVSGTLRQIGFFADATAAANSGVLGGYIAINIAKTVAQTLSFDYDLTIG